VWCCSKGLNICGQVSVRQVLVMALAGCLPRRGSGVGCGVVAVDMFIGRWIFYLGWSYGRRGKGTMHRVGVRRKQASCHGLGWGAMLEGMGCRVKGRGREWCQHHGPVQGVFGEGIWLPYGGIGCYIVVYQPLCGGEVDGYQCGMGYRCRERFRECGYRFLGAVGLGLQLG